VAQEELFSNARRGVTGVGLMPGLGFQLARADAQAARSMLDGPFNDAVAKAAKPA